MLTTCILLGKRGWDTNSVFEADAAVLGLEKKAAPVEGPALPVWRYGTVDCGWALCCLAWTSWKWAWRVGQPPKDEVEDVKVIEGPRFPLTLLRKDPVDLLVVERGHLLVMPKAVKGPGCRWLEMILATTPVEKRP